MTNITIGPKANTTMTTFKNTFVKIDTKSFKGSIPADHELIVVDRDDTEFVDATALYGFDELHQFDSSFKNPVHGFLKTEVITH